MGLLQEWFLEWPLSNFSEKLLLKHRLHFQDAQERIISRQSFNISILNPIPGGREPFGDNENQGLASLLRLRWLHKAPAPRAESSNNIIPPIEPILLG